VLLAGILILLGLLPAMYTSKPSCGWRRAEGDRRGPEGRRLRLQRRSQFEEEFDKVVSELRRSSEEKVGT